MVKEDGDFLGELYSYDSQIEDHGISKEGSLAYQDILNSFNPKSQQLCAKLDKLTQDSVWSLAAQLLTKHFFKFPELQMQALELLLELCQPQNSQAVRIHTIRSLLQLDKTSREVLNHSITPVAKTKVRVYIRELLEQETSGVIMRHLTQLDKSMSETTSLEEEDKKKQGSSGSSSTSNHKHEDHVATNAPLSTKASSPIQISTSHNTNTTSSSISKSSANNATKSLVKDRSTVGIIPSAYSTCPPTPFLFVGGLTKPTIALDIVDFFRAIEPEMNTTSVSLRPSTSNSTLYAFVTFKSTVNAERGLELAMTKKLNHRSLAVNFARGPAVSIVNAKCLNRNSENILETEGKVWDSVLYRLKKYGPLSVIKVGQVKYANVDSAKESIKKRFIDVDELKFELIYDEEAQLILHQGTIHSKEIAKGARGEESFALKSGRVVGNSGHDSNSSFKDKPHSQQRPSSRSRSRSRSRRHQSRSLSQSSQTRTSNRRRSPTRAAKHHSSKQSRSRSRSPSSGRNKNSSTKKRSSSIDYPPHHSTKSTTGGTSVKCTDSGDRKASNNSRVVPQSNDVDRYRKHSHAESRSQSPASLRHSSEPSKDKSLKHSTNCIGGNYEEEEGRGRSRHRNTGKDIEETSKLKKKKPYDDEKKYDSSSSSSIESYEQFKRDRQRRKELKKKQRLNDNSSSPSHSERSRVREEDENKQKKRRYEDEEGEGQDTRDRYRNKSPSSPSRSSVPQRHHHNSSSKQISNRSASPPQDHSRRSSQKQTGDETETSERQLEDDRYSSSRRRRLSREIVDERLVNATSSKYNHSKSSPLVHSKLHSSVHDSDSDAYHKQRVSPGRKRRVDDHADSHEISTSSNKRSRAGFPVTGSSRHRRGRDGDEDGEDVEDRRSLKKPYISNDSNPPHQKQPYRSNNQHSSRDDQDHHFNSKHPRGPPYQGGRPSHHTNQYDNRRSSSPPSRRDGNYHPSMNRGGGNSNYRDRRYPTNGPPHHNQLPFDDYHHHPRSRPAHFNNNSNGPYDSSYQPRGPRFHGGTGGGYRGSGGRHSNYNNNPYNNKPPYQNTRHGSSSRYPNAGSSSGDGKGGNGGAQRSRSRSPVRNERFRSPSLNASKTTTRGGRHSVSPPPASISAAKTNSATTKNDNQHASSHDTTGGGKETSSSTAAIDGLNECMVDYEDD